MATSVKHLLRILWKVISLPLAINSIPHRLASNRVFGVKLWQMIINICLFVTIVWPIVLFLIKIFHLLTWKPAAGVSHKSPLQRHRVTGDQNLSQYVLGNPKSLLLLAINSIPHRLASNRVFGVKLWQMIINICLFVTIVWPIVLFLIKIFHLLTWKPAAGVSHKSPLQRHRVTGDQNLSQYVLGNPKSLLLLEMWYMIRQYQSIFIKTCL